MSRRQRNSFFQCQQFRIEQGDCAMKVTTDASLLGAYAKVSDAKRILDIGAGTGLLSLFAAQRSTAAINAVELDAGAARQARLNFEHSPWSDRLRLLEMDVRVYAKQPATQYDVILCNPPFFTDSTKNSCERAALARHNTYLPLSDLIQSIDALLSSEGVTWLLLPLPETETVIRLAEDFGLYPQERMQVRNSAEHLPHREIIALSRGPKACAHTVFTLYKQHPYHTRAAAELFGPYYTHMKVEDE